MWAKNLGGEGELLPVSIHKAINLSSRGPANIIPDDEIEIEPIKQTLWYENLLVEDDRGVLVGVREQLKFWREREEYVSNWDLESTGLYRTPDIEAKKRYLQKNLLRYLDKRLSGEIRNAEKNSTLHRVGQVQTALRPNAEARISEKIKIKFRARVLQGKAFILVKNPWVDNRTTISATGKVEVAMNRSFKDLGIATRVRYNVNESEYLAEIDKTITSKITARISSHQNDKTMIFESEANSTLQLLFHHSF